MATIDLTGNKMLVVIPVTVGGIYKLDFFDSDNFDCEVAGIYKFKQEEIVEGHLVTLHRVKVTYKDLGTVTFSIYCEVMNQLFKAPATTSQIQTKSQVKTVGGDNDGKLKDIYFDIGLTGLRPQIYIIRGASSGPLCISKIIAYVSDEGGDYI